jgi:cytochrome c peroxidase
MSSNRIKLVIQAALFITVFCVVLGLKTAPGNIGVTHAVDYFKTGSQDFSRSSLTLKNAIAALDKNKPATLTEARMALKLCRLDYKKIEFFMNYFFESSAFVFNKPAKVEVEEPYMEYQEPSGFQFIESLLFEDDPPAHGQTLMQQADLIQSSAADLNSLLYQFEAKDDQILESLRLEVLRVLTLSITGYDAPELKSGIAESQQSLQAVAQILSPFLHAETGLKHTGQTGQELTRTLERAIAYLAAHPDFDSFDRMEFLTSYGLPLQEILRDFIDKGGMFLNTRSALNYQAKNIFSPDAIPATAFPAAVVSNAAMITLGKKLFLEKALSGNQQRNCASCHHPDKYFSDGLSTSLAFDGQAHVKRNAPTLLYAGFQYSQFWDGHAASLPEQVKAVISNPLEMNGDHHVILDLIRKNKTYVADFKLAFPVKDVGEEVITTDKLANALAAYVMGLGPRNSAFDRYIAGDHQAMSEAEIKGFNLFMGKGQCGSCHFAPLFNGLIPPFYRLTEYEILGTPANDDFTKLEKDSDHGRKDFFPISYYEAAFKTPTVRNAGKTAPYMHNGVFKDLEKVVQFYNLGGGAGLHLDIPLQTLSSKPLHLSDEEVKQIVVFMQSLTDRLE